MPLPSSSVTRTRLHVRRTSYEGYERSDGRFDIDARLSDIKDHDYTLLTGVRKGGEPVHDMRCRVTLTPDLVIQAIEVHVDRMPYPGACDRIEPAYERLIGADLMRGFRKTLYELMGGVQGCTHVTELLANLPTAAVQMLAGLRSELDGSGANEKPFQLDRCHALDTSGETVARFYPRWHRSTARVSE
jgi:hypothetical protein